MMILKKAISKKKGWGEIPHTASLRAGAAQRATGMAGLMVWVPYGTRFRTESLVVTNNGLRRLHLAAAMRACILVSVNDYN